MPLIPGKSDQVKSQNIKEMMNSSTFASDKPQPKRQQMAVAAAFRKARSKNAPHRVHSHHRGQK